MARLAFPEFTFIGWPVGTVVTVYRDKALTALADVGEAADDAPGEVSTLTVGRGSTLPAFYGPDAFTPTLFLSGAGATKQVDAAPGLDLGQALSTALDGAGAAPGASGAAVPYFQAFTTDGTYTLATQYADAYPFGVGPDLSPDSDDTSGGTLISGPAEDGNGTFTALQTGTYRIVYRVDTTGVDGGLQLMTIAGDDPGDNQRASIPEGDNKGVLAAVVHLTADQEIELRVINLSEVSQEITSATATFSRIV